MKVPEACATVQRLISRPPGVMKVQGLPAAYRTDDLHHVAMAQLHVGELATL